MSMDTAGTKQRDNNEPEDKAKATIAGQSSEIERRMRRLKEIRLAREAAGLGPIGE